MRHARLLAHALPAALVVTAAACASDRATGPATTFDVTQVLGSAALPATVGLTALGALSGAPTAALAGLVGPSTTAARNCAWNDGTQAFTCAAVSANGLTTTFAYTPLDAQGAPQRTPDRATTAAVRTTSTTQGTFTIPSATGAAVGSLTVDQRQETTIRGLLTGPRTLDGTMTMTSAGTFTGQSLPGTRVTQTTAGLVLPDGASPWPTAGTVTTDVVDVATGQSVGQQVMTFNGTSTVTLVMTSAGVTQRCTLDLAATSAPGTTALRCTAG